MTTSRTEMKRGGRRSTLPEDVWLLGRAAEELGIALSTAYRIAEAGEFPGAFKVGAQWRVSVPRFRAAVHGEGVIGSGDGAA